VHTITFGCCVSDMKDMGWICLAEVRVVVDFYERGNEHEICVSSSGRGTLFVAEELAGDADGMHCPYIPWCLADKKPQLIRFSETSV
jgi:hypothetical protein